MISSPPTEIEVPVVTAFPAHGFVRLPAIIGPRGLLPVSRSTWWAGVRSGGFPKGVKLGPNITAWRAEDIRSLIERLGNEGGSR
jgi:predicted DNA-binding transcriptional regulator AlpA